MIQVEQQMSQWREGSFLLVYDSYLHVLRNVGEEERVVLLVDLWHPDLDIDRIRRVFPMPQTCKSTRDAVQAVLTKHVLSLTITSWLPCKDLGAFGSACRAAVIDETYWRQRAQYEFGLKSVVHGSWREACAEQLITRFSPRALSVEGACEVQTPVVKIFLTGNAGVGKTSFVLRLCDDTFMSTYSATMGIDFKQLPVRCANKDLALQAWDTAGSAERFRALIRSYYRCADIVLICYDSTDRESFGNSWAWAKDVLDYGRDDAIIGLIATKCDLVDSRQVSAEEGIAFAAELRSILPSGIVHFTETSSKTGIGVEHAATKAVRHLVLNPFVQLAPPEPSAPTSAPPSL